MCTRLSRRFSFQLVYHATVPTLLDIFSSSLSVGAIVPIELHLCGVYFSFGGFAIAGFVIIHVKHEVIILVFGTTRGFTNGSSNGMDEQFDHISYVGSVRVVAFQHDDRLELIKQHMERYRDCSRAKPVLLIVSVTGIKVCSPDGTVVHMAHALKRISYATCDLQHNQFCFLAREPKGHYSNQFCHLFVTKTAQQAEELNSIVGNAFRMAYATQLKNQNSTGEMKKSLLHGQDHGLSTWNKIMSGKPLETTETRATSSYTDKCFQTKPNSIPGLRVFENTSPGSNQSTPTSDESNSPTELNIYKKLLEKPPLIKRVPVNIKEILYEEGFPSTRPTPEGCISFQKESCASSPSCKRKNKTEMFALRNSTTSCSTLPFSHMDKCAKTLSENSCSSSDNENTIGTNKSYKRHRHSATQSKITSPLPPPPPPLPPERADSLIKHKEENELKSAPWFQAGIPREITLEVLSQEPVGAFMVRESTTKSGCYALSLRVPREYHPRGIAHYLIIRTGKGYKIKGFTKEFSTLTALITHHSVMQELLPCPLSLSRYNPSFTKSDTNKDFEDIDSDPDYNTLADFRKMMADLNV